MLAGASGWLIIGSQSKFKENYFIFKCEAKNI
jgi:hypothetical protein